MVTVSEIKDLELALHRKLLNVNSDIRVQRKRKFQDKVILSILKDKSKCLDATLSACKQLYIHFENTPDPTTLYRSYKRLYSSI